jgi:hypothetical protein
MMSGQTSTAGQLPVPPGWKRTRIAGAVDRFQLDVLFDNVGLRERCTADTRDRDGHLSKAPSRESRIRYQAG